MFIYARSKQCDLGPIYAITNRQRIRIYPDSYWNSSWSKFHRIQDVYIANIPKKTRLYSRFLLLRIYLDSSVNTSANTERFKVCPVTLQIYLDKYIYTVI